MMTAVEGMHGGLNALAEALQVERLGPMHQAGSDSLLTAKVFFTFAQKHLGENWDEKRQVPPPPRDSGGLISPSCSVLLILRFRGELFGLGNNYTKYKSRNPTTSSQVRG
jgi:hypothetical protein